MTSWVKKITKRHENEEENDKVVEEVKKFLNADTGTIISIVIFCGYFFTMVQQLARYAYYGVETTYLLYIDIEKILLGTAYLIAFFVWMYLIYRMQKRKRYIIGLLEQIPVCLFACFLAYSLTLRNITDFFIIFLVLLFLISLVIKICSKVINKNRKNSKKSIKELVCVAFFILAFFVIVFQTLVESYNKRFTYIMSNNTPYAILTTFKDSDFITLESCIDNDKITIYWGHVRLIPISGSIIEENQFKEKVILK